MATAVQVESILGGLTDNSGEPLAAGKVYTYYAGSTTPVSLFSSSDKSTYATNPLILDGHGKAQVWADGRYKFVVKDQYDVTQYTLDNLLYGFDDTISLWGGQSTGSANSHTVSVPATVTAYANGQSVSFIAGYSNTGAVTLQFNALGAVNIVKGPEAISLQPGDIVAGGHYTATYEAYSGTGRFRLGEYPTLADIQRSRFILATNLSGINAITALLTPPISSYETGLAIRFRATATTTDAVTLNLNSLGAKAVQYNNAALVAGEIQANYWYEVVYDGTQFQLLNPSLSASTGTLGATVAQVQDGGFIWGGTSTGTLTAYAINLTPALTAYATGQRLTFKAHVANGAAPTLAINALTTKTIKRQGTALVANEIKIGDIVDVVYDGTEFQLLNVVPAPLFVDRTNNRVGIGTTAPSVELDIQGSVGNSQLTKFSADAIGPSLVLGKSRSATVGSNSSVSQGDVLGNILFRASGNSAYFNAAQITAFVDAALGSQIPAGFIVYTATASAGLAERLRLTSSGRVGIGTTDPQAPLSVSGAMSAAPTVAGVHLGTNATYSAIELANSTGSYIDFTATSTDKKGRILYDNTSNVMSFETDSAERFRVLADGEMRIGTITAPPFSAQMSIDSGANLTGGYIKQSSAAYYCLQLHNSASSGTRNLIGFYKDTTTPVRLGVISHDGTSTTYSTSSDYRLKEQVELMRDRLELVKKLKPSTFVWKDGQVPGQGFIAHELQQHVPEAVIGEKDAVDSEGNPIYQAVDLSFLVATLTAAIQELAAKVEALEGR